MLIEGRCWCRVGGGRGCRSAPHSAQSAPSPTRAHLSSLRCPVRLRKLLTPSVWAGLAGTAKPAEGSSGALCVVLAHVPTPGSPGAPEQRCGHHGWLSALAGGVQPPREAFWLCFLLCKEPVLGGGSWPPAGQHYRLCLSPSVKRVVTWALRGPCRGNLLPCLVAPSRPLCTRLASRSHTGRAEVIVRDPAAPRMPVRRGGRLV